VFYLLFVDMSIPSLKLARTNISTLLDPSNQSWGSYIPVTIATPPAIAAPTLRPIAVRIPVKGEDKLLRAALVDVDLAISVASDPVATMIPEGSVEEANPLPQTPLSVLSNWDCMLDESWGRTMAYIP